MHCNGDNPGFTDRQMVTTTQIFIANSAQTVSGQQISTSTRYSCARNANMRPVFLDFPVT
jgi:hypothetical protein